MNLIKDHKFSIMDEWSKRVHDSIPAASSQSQLALYDSLPDFLDNLADQLGPQSESEHKVSNAKGKLIGKVHGQHRANSSYSIDQMIKEYFILKDVIAEFLAAQNKWDPETQETLTKTFQTALQVSASQFSKSLLDSHENFILGLAHDLKSPLMVVKMQAEIMEKKVGTSKSTEKIKISVDKINEMIEYLLDSLRTNTTNTAELEGQDFELRQLAQEVVESYEDIHPGGIRIEGDPIWVRWNRGSMERVFDNLLSNAVKYGDENLPITLTLRHDEKNVFFSIHNYGDPIPTQDQIHLFEKFKRSNAHKDKKGWGIGLSYVKSIIEGHKGIVLVHSDETGTTFKFELPRNVGEAQRRALNPKEENPTSRL